MSAHWYVLHRKPMKEALLWEQLHLQEIESDDPCIPVHPVNAHARNTVPYFPGALFGCVDQKRIHLSILRRMPGAAGIVSFGRIPSSIPETMLAATRKHVNEINAAGSELFHGLNSGDIVTIQGGPFNSCDAIFDACLSADDRVRVFLGVLNRQHFPLELSSRQIQRKKH